jgi:hypothetical protein
MENQIEHCDNADKIGQWSNNGEFMSHFACIQGKTISLYACQPSAIWRNFVYAIKRVT